MSVQTRLAEMGFLELILKAIDHHSRDTAVVESACVALYSVSFNGRIETTVVQVPGSCLVSESNKLLLFQLGTLNRIISIISHHLETIVVIERACALASSLAGHGILFFFSIATRF